MGAGASARARAGGLVFAAGAAGQHQPGRARPHRALRLLQLQLAAAGLLHPPASQRAGAHSASAGGNAQAQPERGPAPGARVARPWGAGAGAADMDDWRASVWRQGQGQRAVPRRGGGWRRRCWPCCASAGPRWARRASCCAPGPAIAPGPGGTSFSVMAARSPVVLICVPALSCCPSERHRTGRVSLPVGRGMSLRCRAWACRACICCNCASSAAWRRRRRAAPVPGPAAATTRGPGRARWRRPAPGSVHAAPGWPNALAQRGGHGPGGGIAFGFMGDPVRTSRVPLARGPHSHGRPGAGSWRQASGCSCTAQHQIAGCIRSAPAPALAGRRAGGGHERSRSWRSRLPVAWRSWASSRCICTGASTTALMCGRSGEDGAQAGLLGRQRLAIPPGPQVQAYDPRAASARPRARRAARHWGRVKAPRRCPGGA